MNKFAVLLVSFVILLSACSTVTPSSDDASEDAPLGSFSGSSTEENSIPQYDIFSHCITNSWHDSFTDDSIVVYDFNEYCLLTFEDKFIKIPTIAANILSGSCTQNEILVLYRGATDTVCIASFDRQTCNILHETSVHINDPINSLSTLSQDCFVLLSDGEAQIKRFFDGKVIGISSYNDTRYVFWPQSDVLSPTLNAFLLLTEDESTNYATRRDGQKHNVSLFSFNGKRLANFDIPQDAGYIWTVDGKHLAFYQTSLDSIIYDVFDSSSGDVVADGKQNFEVSINLYGKPFLVKKT